MIRRSGRALTALKTPTFKLRAELVDKKGPAAPNAESTAAPEVLAMIKASAPGREVVDGGAAITDVETLKATCADDVEQATVAALAKALQIRGDGGATDFALQQCMRFLTGKPSREGLTAVFKAADVLQPPIKALSEEIRAALRHVESGIRTTTPEAAQTLQKLFFVLRSETLPVAFEALHRSMAVFTDSANGDALDAVLKAVNALQPRVKVLSEEVAAMLGEVEPMIQGSSARVARELQELFLTIRRDDPLAAFDAVRDCVRMFTNDTANRRGLTAVFKAAEALQPQIKVLSKGVQAAVRRVEATIQTATPKDAHALQEVAFALRRDDPSVAFDAVRHCVLVFSKDTASRQGLTAVFKAAEVLQPQVKVLSKGVQAAVRRVEATIQTATPKDAHALQEVAFALRRDDPSAVFDMLQARNSIFSKQESYSVLAEVVTTAIVPGTFADRLSASEGRFDVFDLSKVFFKTPVAGSPFALCVFHNRQAPLLAARTTDVKLCDPSQFVGNEDFTKALTHPVNIHNVDTAIAVYGDSGAGKTMLVTWGSQCPVLYFEGQFHVGYDWGVLESSDPIEQDACRELRGKYMAALVVLQVAKKLAQLGILDAPQTEGEMENARELAKSRQGRKKLTTFADDVFDELNRLGMMRQFGKQHRVAVVFDEQGGHPTFARCIRDGVTEIRPLLKKWLEAEQVSVIITGTGLRAATANDSRPTYMTHVVASPTLAFEALLSPSHYQIMEGCLANKPHLRSDCNAVLTNARLAVVAASMITSAFETNVKDLRDILRAAMLQFCTMNNLSERSTRTKSDASVFAVALFLFQKDKALMDRLLTMDLARDVCCKYGMQAGCVCYSVAGTVAADGQQPRRTVR